MFMLLRCTFHFFQISAGRREEITDKTLPELLVELQNGTLLATEVLEAYQQKVFFKLSIPCNTNALN